MRILMAGCLIHKELLSEGTKEERELNYLPDWSEKGRIGYTNDFWEFLLGASFLFHIEYYSIWFAWDNWMVVLEKRRKKNHKTGWVLGTKTSLYVSMDGSINNSSTMDTKRFYFLSNYPNALCFPNNLD